MMNKFFFIELKIFQAGLDILVNGFPVFFQTDGDLLEANIPINQFIKNGNNKIKIMLKPIKKDLLLHSNTVCEIKVKVSNNEREIVNFIAPDFSQKKEIKFIEEKDFNADININYLYFSSNKLDNFEKNIIFFYQNIWQILKDNDVESFLELSKIRDTEVAVAYNLTYNARIEDIKPFLAKILKSLKLQPIDYSKMKVNYYCENRIACIEDEDFNPVIRFEKNENKIISTAKMSIYLCLNEKDELIIIR